MSTNAREDPVPGVHEPDLDAEWRAFCTLVLRLVVREERRERAKRLTQCQSVPHDPTMSASSEAERAP